MSSKASPEQSQRYYGQFRPAYSQLHEDRDLLWVVPVPIRYLVGVVGYRFAGKSTVLNYLTEKHGFRLYSLSNALRNVALERGIPLEPRRRLQDLGDEVRAEHCDGGYLARYLLRQIRADLLTHRPGTTVGPKIAVGGFKHPDEVRIFRKLSNFSLLRVDADDDVRFQRAHESGVLAAELEGFADPPSEERTAFSELIDRRDRDADPSPWTGGYGQSVDAVIDQVADNDVVLPNGGDLATLQRRCTEVIHELDARGQRV